jgi:hypothetical protein
MGVDHGLAVINGECIYSVSVALSNFKNLWETRGAVSTLVHGQGSVGARQGWEPGSCLSHHGTQVNPGNEVQR